MAAIPVGWAAKELLKFFNIGQTPVFVARKTQGPAIVGGLCGAYSDAVIR